MKLLSSYTETSNEEYVFHNTNIIYNGNTYDCRGTLSDLRTYFNANKLKPIEIFYEIKKAYEDYRNKGKNYETDDPETDIIVGGLFLYNVACLIELGVKLEYFANSLDDKVRRMVAKKVCKSDKEVLSILLNDPDTVVLKILALRGVSKVFFNSTNKVHHQLKEYSRYFKLRDGILSLKSDIVEEKVYAVTDNVDSEESPVRRSGRLAPASLLMSSNSWIHKAGFTFDVVGALKFDKGKTLSKREVKGIQNALISIKATQGIKSGIIKGSCYVCLDHMTTNLETTKILIVSNQGTILRAI